MVDNLVYNKVLIHNGEIGYLKLGCVVMINRYAATLYNWDKYLISALAKVFALYLFDARQVGILIRKMKRLLTDTLKIFIRRLFN